MTRPHESAVVRVVLPAEEPHLLRPLLADLPGEQPDPVAAVERAHAGAGLTKARVVGGDREVATEVQHVPTADRVAGDHRDHRLREPPDLELEIEDVQATDPLLVHVAVVTTNALVPTGGEGERALAREQDDADLRIVAGGVERGDQLAGRERSERVPYLRSRDGDLRDALGCLVADVREPFIRPSFIRPRPWRVANPRPF